MLKRIKTRNAGSNLTEKYDRIVINNMIHRSKTESDRNVFIRFYKSIPVGHVIFIRRFRSADIRLQATNPVALAKPLDFRQSWWNFTLVAWQIFMAAAKSQLQNFISPWGSGFAEDDLFWSVIFVIGNPLLGESIVFSSFFLGGSLSKSKM